MISFQRTGQDGCSFCLVESVFQVISILHRLQLGGMCLLYYAPTPQSQLHPCYNSPDTILYKEFTASIWHYQSIVVADGVRGSKVELSYILTSPSLAATVFPREQCHCDSIPCYTGPLSSSMYFSVPFDGPIVTISMDMQEHTFPSRRFDLFSNEIMSQVKNMFTVWQANN